MTAKAQVFCTAPNSESTHYSFVADADTDRGGVSGLARADSHGGWDEVSVEFTMGDDCVPRMGLESGLLISQDVR